MTNKLVQKLQAMTGKLPQGVAGTRSITVLEGDTLRTVSGGASLGYSSGGSSIYSSGGSIRR